MNHIFVKALKSIFLTFLGFLSSYIVYALSVISLDFSNSSISPENISPAVGTLLATRTGAVSLEKDFLIKSDLTINVPSAYSTIEDAFNWLTDYHIQNGVTVTVKVSDGVYNLGSSISIHHVNGNQIQLIGNTSTPGNVTINCTTSCFILKNSAIGLIDGFTLIGTTNVGSAIDVHTSSYANLGASMVYQNFNQTVFANLKSYIDMRGGVVRNSGYNGVRSSLASTVLVENADIRNSEYGVFVYKLGYMMLINTTSRDNSTGSLNVGLRSTVTITGSTITNPGQNVSGESYIQSY